ncbi:MAG: O-antigen ligase family protein [Flavobacteriales bacterium]|nr:O-antigen ligase family protein [Flavobacteriales bacterium]
MKTISVLLVLFIVCSLFSSSPITSFNYLLKFGIPFFFYIIGYNLISSKELFNYFISKIWLFFGYFTIYIVIVNVFGIGEGIYSGGLKAGYYSLNGLYVPTFSTLFFIFFYRRIQTRKERILGLLFAIATITILVLLLKRTLILLVAIGLVFYLFKTISVKRIFQTIVLGVIFVLIGFYFREQLTESFDARSSRFSGEYNVAEEGRFTEIIFLFDYMSNKPTSLIFGTGEVFNDRETVSRIYGVDREAHNSYIRIFWSAGFVGLAIFLLLYFQQFKMARKGYRYFKAQADFELSHLFFFVTLFICMRFLNDFSSGITYLSYNAFSLIIIGGSFQILKNSFVGNTPLSTTANEARHIDKSTNL